MNVLNVNKPSAPPALQKRTFSESDVVSGRLNLPRRVFGFGGEKVGKTSFASAAPDAVFIPLDQGAPHLSIDRLPRPESWDELIEIVSLPERWGRPWKTLVLDPINWAEEMAWARMLHGPGARPSETTRDEVEKHGGGFSKGYDAAVGIWRQLQLALERQWLRGMNIIILAHAKKVNFKDPSGVAYERWEPAMHEKASGIFKQWCDDILFLRHEVLAKAERGGKTVAVETGERVIHTTWSKAWDAGNRADLPEEMQMSWAVYWAGVESYRARVDDLKKEIAELSKEIGDADVTKRASAAVQEAKDNPESLALIVSRLRARLNLNASNIEEKQE